VNALEVVAGVFFVITPWYHRASIRYISKRVERAGGDGDEFARRLTRRPIMWGLNVVAVLGVVLIVLGLTGAG
jgi:hypothetical protein